MTSFTSSWKLVSCHLLLTCSRIRTYRAIQSPGADHCLKEDRSWHLHDSDRTTTTALQLERTCCDVFFCSIKSTRAATMAVLSDSDTCTVGTLLHARGTQYCPKSEKLDELLNKITFDACMDISFTILSINFGCSSGGKLCSGWRKLWHT